VPRDLVTIVHKAADRDPARRYQTAAELAADLQRFLADEPIRARRTSVVERFSRWCRRNPMVASLSATVALLLITVAVVSSVSALRLRAALEDTRKAKVDATDKLWISDLNQAAARRMSRGTGQRFASLRALQEALKLPVPDGRSRDELRTEAIAALLLPDFEKEHEWDGFPLGASGFAVDPAFERYARGDQAGNIVVCRLGSNDALFKIPGRGIISSYGGLEFSPDGQFLHQQYGEVTHVSGGRLWKLSGADPILVLDERHCGFAFEPNGPRCAIVNLDGTVRVYETASGRELRRYAAAAFAGPFRLAWNPAKPDWLLVRGLNSSRVLDLATGKFMPGGPTLADGYSWVDWHPQGRLLAVCGQDRNIYLWDVVADRNAFPPFKVHKNNGVVCRFNHAGDRLLSTDWNGVWRLWDVGTGQLLLSMPAAGVFLQFSPDDHLVAAETSMPQARVHRFRSGSELRTLAPLGQGARNGYLNRGMPVLHPDGRLLAVAAGNGVAVIDLLRGDELTLLPAPGDGPLAFEDDGSLLTCGVSGVLRWPLHKSTPTDWRYAAPELIVRTRRVMHAHSASRDAQTLGIPDDTGAIVWRRADKSHVRLEPQHDVRSCAISPDGHWAATGTFGLREGPGAKVWDARTGKKMVDLPAGAQCWVHFSSDGRWLLTTGGGCRIWHVGTWQEGPDLHADPKNAEGAFSHDGRALALGDAPGVVRLVDTDSGREIARLTTPELTRLVPCCFTPDGATLVTLGTESETLHLFDLRAIRGQLAELGLDWDAPPLPAPAAAFPEPLYVAAPSPKEFARWHTVSTTLHAADQKRRAGDHAERLRLLRDVVQAYPDQAVALNELAWALLTAPEAMRDPKQALALARQAVSLAPETPLYENTLGVALYRSGQLADAIPALEKSLHDGDGAFDAFDLYFLAMCHHRLGDAAKARECHERAVKWVDQRRGKLGRIWEEELTAFRAEADAVLARPPGEEK
jgi:WD40 repeat protein/Tfp pilus assembly protein PilF